MQEYSEEYGSECSFYEKMNYDQGIDLDDKEEIIFRDMIANMYNINENYKKAKEEYFKIIDILENKMNYTEDEIY